MQLSYTGSLFKEYTGRNGLHGSNPLDEISLFKCYYSYSSEDRS